MASVIPTSHSGCWICAGSFHLLLMVGICSVATSVIDRKVIALGTQ